MKIRHIAYWAALIGLIAPLLVQAEIYKWKDKNGVVRYSDTPPPPEAKQESVIGKKPKGSPSTQTAAPSDSPAAKSSDSAVKTAGDKKGSPQASKSSVDVDAAKSAEELAAKQRQLLAEQEKKNKEIEEKNKKAREDSCKSARSNYEMYSQGGRLTRLNEKGEREYMDDQQLKESAARAQAEMAEYCS